MQAEFQGVRFSDADVINPGDYIPTGDYNPHRVRPWLLHDHGFPLAVVFACCLQDAVDVAADAGKLDRYKVEDTTEYEPECEGLSFLGNAGEPFDTEGMDAIELPNPPFSFIALFNARGA